MKPETIKLRNETARYTLAYHEALRAEAVESGNWSMMGKLGRAMLHYAIAIIAEADGNTATAETLYRVADAYAVGGPNSERGE